MTTEELLEKANTLIESYKPVPVYLIRELVAEIEKLQRSASEWEIDARRYANSADYWCNECAKLRDVKYDCPQGIKCPYLQDKEADYKNLRSAWQKMFASKQLVLGDLEKTKERLNYSELLREAQANQIERQRARIEVLEKITNNKIRVKDLECAIDCCRRTAGYTEQLELEFLKVYSRMFFYENNYEGKCSFDCDTVAREYLAGIKSRHL